MNKKCNNTKHSKLKTFLLSFIQKEKKIIKRSTKVFQELLRTIFPRIYVFYNDLMKEKKIIKRSTSIPGIVTNYFS